VKRLACPEMAFARHSWPASPLGLAVYPRAPRPAGIPAWLRAPSRTLSPPIPPGRAALRSSVLSITSLSTRLPCAR